MSGRTSPLTALSSWSAFRWTIVGGDRDRTRTGLGVTVHTTQQDAAREAIDAGADGLEHGVTVGPVTDGALFEVMPERDVTYTPTLWIPDAIQPDPDGFWGRPLPPVCAWCW